jgi:hypothetical protein
VIPVISGATGIVTEGLNEYLETLARKHSIDFLKKSCGRNITHKREWWDEPLVQEDKYQDEGNL